MVIKLPTYLNKFLNTLTFRVSDTTPAIIDVFDKNSEKISSFTLISSERFNNDNFNTTNLINLLVDDFAISELSLEEFEWSIFIAVDKVKYMSENLNRVDNRMVALHYNLAQYNRRSILNLFKNSWGDIFNLHFNKTYFSFDFVSLIPKFIREDNYNYTFSYKYNKKSLPPFTIPKSLINKNPNSIDIIKLVNNIQFNKVLNLDTRGLSIIFNSPNPNVTSVQRSNLNSFIDSVYKQLNTDYIQVTNIGKLSRFIKPSSLLEEKYHITLLSANKYRIVLNKKQITFTFPQDVKLNSLNIEQILIGYLNYLKNISEVEFYNKLQDIKRFYSDNWFLTKDLKDTYPH